MTLEEKTRLASDPTTPGDVLGSIAAEWLAGWERLFRRGATHGPYLYPDSSYCLTGATSGHHHFCIHRLWNEGSPGGYLDAKDQAIGDSLAANPNTPPIYLAEIACHFPQAFGRNPAASLLALESPEAVARVPERKKRWAAGSAACPESFLRVLAVTSDDADL
jgi:hypothetical protein